MAVNSEKSDTVLPRIQQNYEKSKANVTKGRLQTCYAKQKTTTTLP